MIDAAASFLNYGILGELLLASGQYQQANKEWERIGSMIRRESIDVSILTYASLGRWKEAMDMMQRIEMDRFFPTRADGSERVLFTMVDLLNWIY